MTPWYATLNRPPLTPPNWVFSPVWTVLYITMAISIFSYYRSSSKSHVGWTSALLIVHLMTNFLWTYLFFGLRSPAMALIDIVVLDISLFVLICWFWKSSVFAGVILIPYFAWALFATYLNCGFYRLNWGSNNGVHSISENRASTSSRNEWLQVLGGLMPDLCQ